MKFSKAVVKGRIPILIVTLLLMIPAVLGMIGTRINCPPTWIRSSGRSF